ncbi:MAG: type I secretion system permease/ATPase [Pseudomonadales bacterium]|nr:MAG: type I secretion system permease/ATPase [Pseudomonadales bacterium]
MSLPIELQDPTLSELDIFENDETQQESSLQNDLIFSVAHILTLQGYPVDNIRLRDVVQTMSEKSNFDSLASLIEVLQGVGIDDLPVVLEQPDAAFLPLVGFHHKLGWGVIDSQTPQGNWHFTQSSRDTSHTASEFAVICRLNLSGEHLAKKQATFTELLKSNLKNYKGIIIEAVVASFMINMLALATSLFSMQVYDRVIPTSAQQTLIVLASGVALVILFESFMKFTRSKIMDKMVVGLDQYLSREVFQRLLKVRIDQMPGSVGSMAAQLRGYEQVRGFFTASTLFGLVDIPMSIIFITLISVIGSPIVAIVPVVAACIAIMMGLYSRKKIDEIAAVGASASYYKTGLLVETVEGVETIKAGGGNWKFLSRWLNVMNITVKNDLDMKHANDYLSYFSQMLQQASYVGIVIVGSFVVINKGMTMGGLIACSILGGRILAPVMQLPGLLVQSSHAKAALKNIESLFALEQDNHGVNYPLAPKIIEGNFQCDDLVYNYLGNDRPAVNVPNLTINAGEKIAILGPIGSGKSTLLKILSGLYAPTQGRVLLDGLDMQQISRETLNEQLGYLQQDHRLFQGTLRENLLIGMPAPSDDVINEAMQKTGLIKLVSSHSSGLDLPISEGGRGLSGGQKQLVAFTRLLLTKPKVFFLDEPTASMDNRQEQQCLRVLNEELKNGQTLIVSTHKTALLELVDRLIIMDNQQIVMDGPKDAVLKQLMQNEQGKQRPQPQRVSTQQPQKRIDVDDTHKKRSETSLPNPNPNPASNAGKDKASDDVSANTDAKNDANKNHIMGDIKIHNREVTMLESMQNQNLSEPNSNSGSNNLGTNNLGANNLNSNIDSNIIDANRQQQLTPKIVQSDHTTKKDTEKTKDTETETQVVSKQTATTLQNTLPADHAKQDSSKTKEENPSSFRKVAVIDPLDGVNQAIEQAKAKQRAKNKEQNKAEKQPEPPRPTYVSIPKRPNTKNSKNSAQKAADRLNAVLPQVRVQQSEADE